MGGLFFAYLATKFAKNFGPVGTSKKGTKLGTIALVYGITVTVICFVVGAVYAYNFMLTVDLVIFLTAVYGIMSIPALLYLLFEEE